MRPRLLCAVLVSLALCPVSSFLSFLSRAPTRTHFLSCSDGKSLDLDDSSLQKAMRKARDCASKQLSPGGGLATADEQSDAAYADLILTSMDQRGIDELDEEDVEMLTKGARMWESGATEQANKAGLLGDLASLFKALGGGAHIVKNKFGET